MNDGPNTSLRSVMAERDAALADLKAERRERDADCYEYAATIERAESAEADLEAARAELHTERVCFADSRATFQGELEAARIGRQAQQEHDAEMLRRKQRDLEAAREALRWYADPGNYDSLVLFDGGERARAALGETPK